MTGGDNSWNLIKLQEGQKVSSKSLTIDFLSEESHVDDDILSNTSSSDELAEFSFRSANEDYQAGIGSISDSLATLTGPKGVGEKRDSSWKIKTWQIIVLTSLVSVSFSLVVQKFWNLWMFSDFPRDVTALTNSGISSGEAAVLYSDFNFWSTPSQTQDQSLTSTQSGPQWKPSGKFYVDFDNRIAYPMPDEDVVGWKRFKADSMILWYTSKSKVKSLLRNDTIKSLQDSCRELLALVADEAAWIRGRFSIASDKALQSTSSIWQSCRDRTDKSVKLFHQWLSSQSKFLPKWKQLGPRLHNTFEGLHNYNHKLHKKAWMWHRRTYKVLEGIHRRH
ncbi:hypothetical protein ZYGR_0E00270 [Zygosaccharomyces rouxii]|uniref:ZYRO0B00682p n=2 Tax=Zygosaccharomyces rouxii TaxID=4956 RepID=C5DQI9_ZYGRC|nr:uncharacterized protein ZYRO0B00682g [Zygosaccharomyces rouxii]KAH9200398.1 hypothetical protein LQ764DRAFT_115330 [Zygosaccharomyces rouxii]GAV47018.1 hypothetical protein ZYGR_0E00270 [Zygosaccharomyces rouxii]CAR26050.1 ZYRO0B00682p [Zygosaccharomyces rouxii]